MNFFILLSLTCAVIMIVVHINKMVKLLKEDVFDENIWSFMYSIIAVILYLCGGIYLCEYLRGIS